MVLTWFFMTFNLALLGAGNRGDHNMKIVGTRLLCASHLPLLQARIYYSSRHMAKIAFHEIEFGSPAFQWPMMTTNSTKRLKVCF